MADCEETLRELYTYLDNELTPETKAVIQHHIDGCPDCLEAFEFHFELKVAIARKCKEELPVGLQAKILSCFGDDALTPPEA